LDAAYKASKSGANFGPVLLGIGRAPNGALFLTQWLAALFRLAQIAPLSEQDTAYVVLGVAALKRQGVDMQFPVQLPLASGDEDNTIIVASDLRAGRYLLVPSIDGMFVGDTLDLNFNPMSSVLRW
jgi:hypothetical protein